MKAAKLKPKGRPSSYTDAAGRAVCLRLSGGESLLKITKEPGMPSQASVYRWLLTNDAFRENYARAREEQAETKFDEITDVARQVLDGEVKPDAARVFIDAIKWQASKLAPKKYGDKLELAGPGEGGAHLHVISSEPMTPDEWATKHGVKP